MNNLLPLFKWGTDCLVSNGYSIEHSPEIVLSTPWSHVIRFATSTENFYLKQTPPSLFLSNEPKIIRLLSSQFHANVPDVIEINNDLHCFLMRDAGISLRQTLKTNFNLALLCQAIKQYAAIQRRAEDCIARFLKLGVPDWRLTQLPFLYDQMLKQTAFLKAEGLTDKELQTLQTLSPKFSAQCKLLASFRIPETIGYHDFHDKNVLLDPNTKRMTFVDWGETAIIHPFFSLHTCLEQSITHHGVTEDDSIYQQLQDACLENWLEFATKEQLLSAFLLAKKIRLFWNILASNQFILSVDRQAYQAYYTNQNSPIADGFRTFLENIH
ncbi:TPA: phosphotransferase [Legionella bozemanae]|uniref:phosphotransferase n=1 Tax=Legionella pneumophila TaxID=446 RepID=UPI00077091F3|nr:phosphotransferase [Legionella pneumophila]HAT9685425.1 phosphotransferase [Legionella pneumophila subsp. pneumophila]CZH13223.1 Phosphotransferase enzyme family [Legionella pneumophila]CZH44037.1 Phosphotransferase enzyme family [Legionella pneumophila]CZH46287.1 Phosphotransferase enzyme family [Legionella pneumophila]HAT9691921.1 phosphotransferase [Legionella pneumophila subsp. pneumophila]